jgi:hypothetical protein
LGGYKKTIGVDNIVQICTDNSSNMRNVASLIICFAKSLFSKLCCSLFKLVIKRLGKSNMGETNCEKGESCFFYTTTPCTTGNISSLWDQYNAAKPH